MREPTKQSPGNGSAEAAKVRDKPQATGNKRFAEQIRKILGKRANIGCGESRSLCLKVLDASGPAAWGNIIVDFFPRRGSRRVQQL